MLRGGARPGAGMVLRGGMGVAGVGVSGGNTKSGAARRLGRGLVLARLERLREAERASPRWWVGWGGLFEAASAPDRAQAAAAESRLLALQAEEAKALAQPRSEISRRSPNRIE